MFRASISVVFITLPSGCCRNGRPAVSARFWSKSLKPFVSVRKMQIVKELIMFGMVIFQSVCQSLAPSMRAASSMSSGMDWSPAM